MSYNDLSADGTLATVQNYGGGHSGYGGGSGGCQVQSTGLCELLAIGAAIAVAVAAFGALALALGLGKKRKRRSFSNILERLREFSIFEGNFDFKELVPICLNVSI